MLAGIGLITVPVAAAIALRRLDAQQQAARAAADATGGFTAAVEETVTGIAALKGFGGEAPQLARLRDANIRLQRTAVRQAGVEAAWVSAASFVPAAGMAAGLWIGGELVLRGTLSVGALVAFAGWMSLLVSAVQTLTYRLATQGEARAAASRIVEVLNTQPVVRTPVRPAALPSRGAVYLESVTVARDGRKVLEDVHLRVEPGEWVAIAGTTGAGKSMLLRLVPRLTDPAAGAVVVAGCDVTTVDPAVLRRRVGYLGQRATLFAGSIADNLRLASPHATEEELWEALDVADACPVVDALPGRLAAHVGDRGSTLSGGERQRLALARVLLARPAVLVLDDITSALDPFTEARVLDSLRRWAPDSAVLVATHRLRVAAAADRLMLLARGQVVEDGTPAQLLATDSRARTVLAAHSPQHATADLR